MLLAYRYRIYPNTQQKEQIAKIFSCARFVYNQILFYRKELYEKEKRSLSKTACNHYCSRVLKKQYEWLREVDKFALTNAIYHLDAAYQKFFKEHAGYPKYKSKHDHRRSYTTNITNQNIAADFSAQIVKLPKLGSVKEKLHRKFSGQMKSATVSQTPSGTYYVSILADVSEPSVPTAVNESVGIDLGIKEIVITSDGQHFENPKTLYQYERKLIKLQRRLSKKQNGSGSVRCAVLGIKGTRTQRKIFYLRDFVSCQNQKQRNQLIQ